MADRYFCRDSKNASIPSLPHSVGGVIALDMSISIQDVLHATGGKLLSEGALSSFPLSVSTDTRQIKDGDIFVALQGDNFDAHNFLEQAVEKGAKTLLVHEDRGITGVNVVLVKDTLQGLQDLASYWRGELTDRAIGITGSNGKTSTKDLTDAVLSQRFQTKATLGNFNNHIGLPLTVLRNTREDEATIYEMGMNHPGEIAPLCEIARPQIGIITTVGTAHIEHMGSQEEIAKEKGALAAALPADGTLIIPTDVDYKDVLLAMNGGQVLETGIETETPISATGLKAEGNGTAFTLKTPQGEASVLLPLKGRHMVSNALLSAAVGHLYGMSAEEIAHGLSSVELTSGRLRQFSHGSYTILDDTYNANPDSVKVAALTLQEALAEGQKGYLVLGKMAELGDLTDQAHLEVGEYGAQLGLTVISVGEEAKLITEGAKKAGNEPQHFAIKQDAETWLKDNLEEGSMILFKGSRAAAMETVMNTVFPEN